MTHFMNDLHLVEIEAFSPGSSTLRRPHRGVLEARRPPSPDHFFEGEHMINKVILVGRLGKDPEIKSTAGGQTVAKFTMATDEKFTDKSGEKQERTEWHNIVAWARMAEICGQYLRKGSLVYIEGSIRTDSWDDKESGQKRYRTEIIAREMKMLDRKRDSGGDEGGGAGYGSRRPAAATAGGPPEDDDEVPF